MVNLLLMTEKIMGILIMACLTFGLWFLIITAIIITKYFDSKK